MSNISRANRATALIDLNVTPTILESSVAIPSSQNMLGGQQAGSAQPAITDLEANDAQNNSREQHHNPVITNAESEEREARDPVLTSHSKRRRIGSGQTGVNGDALFIDLEESGNTENVDAPPPPPPPHKISFKCPVCLEEVEEATTTRCGHIFCNGCLRAAIKAQKKCPTCRTKANPRSIVRVYLP